VKIWLCEGPWYGKDCGAPVHLQDDDYPGHTLCPLCSKEQDLIIAADVAGYRDGKALGVKVGRFRAPIWQALRAAYLIRQYLNSFRKGFLG
jgi:hypothetical protein